MVRDVTKTFQKGSETTEACTGLINPNLDHAPNSIIGARNSTLLQLKHYIHTLHMG